MDGVIVDHSSKKISLARELGFKFKKKDTHPIMMKKTMPEAKYRELQYYLYDNHKTALSSPLMPGVKTTLSLIQKSKIPFFLISRRQRHALAKKLLIKHNLWPKYFNKKNSFFVEEIKDKEIVAKKLSITHYIDDDQRVLDSLISVKNKYLFDSLGVFKDTPYARIVSWKEISELI